MVERKGAVERQIAQQRAQKLRRQPRLTSFSDIKMRPTYWLWEEDDAMRIPIGELTLFAGHGDVGKSTCGAWLISNITQGTLPGQFYGKPRNCIITAPEDSMERTIKPRLYAAGADMDKVHSLDAVTEEFGNIGISVSLPSDFGILEDAIKELGSAAVFFDSLMSTVDMKYDTHKGRDARQALQPLSGIANRTRCSIIGNVHFNKSSSSDAASRMLGSVEIRNVARAVIYFAKDQDGTRVLSRGKGNLGVEWPPLEYSIKDASFTYRGQDYHPGRFVLGEEASMTAEDILRSEGKERTGASKREMAKIWLIDFLADNGNKVEQGKVKIAAEADGIKWATVEKAKLDAGISHKRDGFGGVMYWYRSANTNIRQNIGGNKSKDDDDK